MAPYPSGVLRIATTIGALACATALAACGASKDRTPTCVDQVKADEATVHSDGLWSEIELTGVGTPVAVHWAAHAEGDPCSRVPGPTDWRYQAVVALTGDDAGQLAHDWSWRPIDATTTPTPGPSSPNAQADLAVPTDLWPALAGYLPAGASWTRSQGYEQSLPGSQWYAVFLDRNHTTMLVFAFDS